jgi:hypothetical protein
VCGGSCYDRALGGLYPEVWQAQQFERIGFPLGEQVVNLRLAVVVSLAQRESSARQTLCWGLADSIPVTRRKEKPTGDSSIPSVGLLSWQMEDSFWRVFGKCRAMLFQLNMLQLFLSFVVRYNHHATCGGGVE